MDAKAKVLTVWIAYAIGLVVTGTPFAGVLMAYFCKSTNTESGVAGHNRAQIRSFWWGFLGWMIAIGFMVGGVASMDFQSVDVEDTILGGGLVIFGLFIGIVVQIWFTIYAIIGIVRASNDKNWPGAEITQAPEEVFG